MPKWNDAAAPRIAFVVVQNHVSEHTHRKSRSSVIWAPNRYCFSMSGWFRPMTVMATNIGGFVGRRIQQDSGRSLFFDSGAA